MEITPKPVRSVMRQGSPGFLTRYSKPLWSLWLAVLLLLVDSQLFAGAQESRGILPASDFDLANDYVFNPGPSVEGDLRVVSHETSPQDADGDGLYQGDEHRLGTDPENVDTDCDLVADGIEVGNAANPSDTDQDGIIDALESLLADSNGNGVSDQDDPDVSRPQIACARFLPFVVKWNNTDSTRLEVKILSRLDISAVFLALPFGDPFLRLNGDRVANDISLFDDGTHGDRIARDGIWTRNGLTIDITGYTFSSNSDSLFFRELKVVTNGSIVDIDLLTANETAMALFIVDPEIVKQPVLLADDVQATAHLLNLVDPILALEVKRQNLRAATLRFYRDYPDDYDFLFFFPELPVFGAPFGQYHGTRNDVQNIGMGQFDDTASYGSAGRLRGAIFLNAANNGPTLHEIMHAWAVAGNRWADLGFSQCADLSHWGVIGLGRGQLGGFDPATLVNNGDGKFTVGSFGKVANGGDSVVYTPLELYLGGFTDPASVPPIIVPKNVACDSLDYSVDDRVTFRADGIQTVAIDEIVDILGGRRVPAYPNTQKAYKAAMIVVSQYKLNAAEISMFNEWSRIFGSDTGEGNLHSFKEATHGFATMDTSIPLPDPATLIAMTKSLEPNSIVTASTTITYVITIVNHNDEPITNTILSDDLPALATYVFGSAVAEPPLVDLTGFPVSTGPFALPTDTSLTIRYNVLVSDSAVRGDVLTNVITLSAPILPRPLTIQSTHMVDPIETYLPITGRN